MIIYNPSKTTVSIIIKGTQYSVGPEGETVVQDSVGGEWLKIHAFLQVLDKKSEVSAIVEKVEKVEKEEKSKKVSKKEKEEVED